MALVSLTAVDEHINAMRCQISSKTAAIAQGKGSGDNRKLISTELALTISILDRNCTVYIPHTYQNNSYWLHLALTWEPSGQVKIFINGHLKSNCSNIAVNKVIGTAGVFVLGQSHRVNFSLKSNRKELYSTTTGSSEPKKSPDSTNSGGNENLEDKNSSKFDESVSFVGRLFNFNVWSAVKSPEFIHGLYNDCKLAYCGTAAQWSDFRQGTRGNIKMKWPTELIWKSK